MKRFLCGITVMLIASAFVSCSDKETESVSGTQLIGDADSGVNISEDDMPYGSTIYELSGENDEHVSVTIDFDRRYFTDADGNTDFDEIYKLHDYVVSIDTNNYDLFNSVTYPGFYEYYCEQNDMTVNDYVDLLSSDLHYDIGDDSVINFIDISDCISSSDEAQSYYDTRDEILTAIGAGEITSRKFVEIGGYTTFKNSEGSYLLLNHSNARVVCIYEIDGQTYIL